MAHFMVPRYVRVLEALPKTPTNKVQKAELRAAGVTSDTWDREAAGIILKRERFNRN
jgi:crotonobetaine/carnitine-CoA ligase